MFGPEKKSAHDARSLVAEALICWKLASLVDDVVQVADELRQRTARRRPGTPVQTAPAEDA